MKKTVEKYKLSYQSLPQIPEMKKLWYLGYWDGVWSGVCEVDGQKCFFDFLEAWYDNNRYPDEDDLDYDTFEAPWYRRFLIVKLTDEQYQELEKRHAKFQRMVGCHTDYDENGKCGTKNSPTATSETLKQYYDEAKVEVLSPMEAATEDHVLGWYEWK